MPTITGVEQFFCMCGPLERKCSYCNRIFRVSPHCSDMSYLSSKTSNLSVINSMLEHRDWINCIFCGNPTWSKDCIRRSKEEIKAERRNQANG